MMKDESGISLLSVETKALLGAIKWVILVGEFRRDLCRVRLENVTSLELCGRLRDQTAKRKKAAIMEEPLAGALTRVTLLNKLFSELQPNW